MEAELNPVGEGVEGYTFVPYLASVKEWKREGHSCSATHKSSMDLIDAKGRSHIGLMTFCSCEPAAATLVRYGFWPSSSKRPSAGLSMELMELLHSLTLECAVSVKGFVNTLRWMNQLSEYEAERLYRLVIGETITQFSYYHRKSQLSNILASDGLGRSPCPVCPETKGTITISLDGNFGLVRKHNSGTSHTAPLYQGVFFADTEKTNQFVESYTNDKCSDKECNNFMAGNAVRSRMRNAKLDVRGVFGSVCRHEFPIVFMDMKHGERLAYSVLLLQTLKNIYADQNLQVIYDIGCVLHRHLKNRDETALTNVDISVPVFHAYGHGASCQLSYSCRHRSGYGLTDGEGTERLWSYLRPLATITKEMTPNHRIDLLTHALHHYVMRKTAGLPKWIGMRAERAITLYDAAEKKLSDFLCEMNVTIEQARCWMDEYKHHMSATKTAATAGFQWQMNYARLLQQYHRVSDAVDAATESVKRSEMTCQLTQLDSSLLKLEAKYKIKRWLPSDHSYQQQLHSIQLENKTKILHKLHQDASERKFLESLLAKYCDGQKTFHRLSSQLKRATKAVRKGVAVYNSEHFHIVPELLPAIVNFDDAKQPDSAIYSCLSHETNDFTDTTPLSAKLKAMELCDMLDRCTEEIERTRQDAISLTQHYAQKLQRLTTAVTESVDIATRSLLLQHLYQLLPFVDRLWSIVLKILPHADVKPRPELTIDVWELLNGVDAIDKTSDPSSTYDLEYESESENEEDEM